MYVCIYTYSSPRVSRILSVIARTLSTQEKVRLQRLQLCKQQAIEDATDVILTDRLYRGTPKMTDYSWTPNSCRNMRALMFLTDPETEWGEATESSNIFTYVRCLRWTNIYFKWVFHEASSNQHLFLHEEDRSWLRWHTPRLPGSLAEVTPEIPKWSWADFPKALEL